MDQLAEAMNNATATAKGEGDSDTDTCREFTPKIIDTKLQTEVNAIRKGCVCSTLFQSCQAVIQQQQCLLVLDLPTSNPDTLVEVFMAVANWKHI